MKINLRRAVKRQRQLQRAQCETAQKVMFIHSYSGVFCPGSFSGKTNYYIVYIVYVATDFIQKQTGKLTDRQA